MIENRDISVVVQGPVENNYQGRMHHEEGITQRCLSSIRAVLPDAKLILSTWPGQQLDDLDCDQLVISEDPGPNRDAVCPANYNRQILSTRAGLDVVDSRYAIKLRSDNVLTHDGFKQLAQRYPESAASDRVFTSKVVINANLSRMYSRGREVAFSPSDFFYFGLTEDIKRIWEQPPFIEQPFAEDLIAANQDDLDHPLEAEQVYCLIWLSCLREQMPRMGHRFDNSTTDLEAWHRFVASNLIILEPETIGLGLRKISQRRTKRINEFTDTDWLGLYKRYCDTGLAIPYSRQRLAIALKRSLCQPFSRLWYFHLKKHL